MVHELVLQDSRFSVHVSCGETPTDGALDAIQGVFVGIFSQLVA
jgi:hypothetical protein